MPYATTAAQARKHRPAWAMPSVEVPPPPSSLAPSKRARPRTPRAKTTTTATATPTLTAVTWPSAVQSMLMTGTREGSGGRADAGRRLGAEGDLVGVVDVVRADRVTAREQHDARGDGGTDQRDDDRAEVPAVLHGARGDAADTRGRRPGDQPGRDP